MELMVGFLEARSSVLNAIHQIVNRMADLNAAANDGLATDSDVQNYNGVQCIAATVGHSA